MEHLPFCSAVKAGDFIFLSGTAALKDDEGNDLIVNKFRITQK